MKNKESERFVAFLDIMGFKNYVYRNSHEAVSKRMSKLYSSLSESEKVNTVLNSGNKVNELVEISVFSDSIVLFSKSDDFESFLSICLVTATIFANCIDSEIPLKGAISKGKITANFEKSLFFGKAIIDAFLLQEELQMYGCILDNKAERAIKSEQYTFQNLIVNRKIHMKNGLVTHYAINWMRLFADDIEGNETIRSEKIIPKLRSFFKQVSGQPRKYVDNTIEFASHYTS